MNNIILNQNSEYYRKCPCCQRAFMASDLRQRYCCQKCHDDYHNRFKRFKRASEPLKNITIPPEQTPTEKIMVALKKNVQIFMAYQIGHEGKWVAIKELIEKGFNFFAYTAKIPISKTSKKYFLEYGHFILSRETDNNYIIRIKTK